MSARQSSKTAGLLAVTFLVLASSGRAQIPGQFAQDFVAGRVPSPEEIAQVEKELAANPGDYRLARKLGKAYFFQYLGEGRVSAIPKPTVRWSTFSRSVKTTPRR